MKKEIKRWVEFWAPGIICGESWSRDIDHADPLRVEWPDNAYAFAIYEREDMVDGGERYTGKARKLGPTYYHPDSKVETLAQVRENPKAGRTLVSNMECNGWDRIIWTRWGNWPQPYKAGKIEILPAPGADR